MASYIYVELDFFAMALLLLMIGFRNRGDVQSMEQKLFNFVLIFTAAAIFFDAFQWFFDGKPGTRDINMASAYFYYGANSVVPFAWLVYCDYKMLGSMTGLRRRMRFYMIPAVLIAILLLSNAWTGCIFSFDAENRYFRGELFFVYTIAANFPALVAIVLAIWQFKITREKAQRLEIKFLLLFMLLPMIGSVVQSFYYGLPLIWIATTVSLFIIYIKVQNRRIYLDELTGLSNRRQIAREFSRRNDVPDPLRRIYAVMIDADDFKKINDQRGHAAGDRMLVCTAAILERVCAPRGDFIARMGGDEFLILASRRADEPLLLPQAIEEATAAFNGGSTDPVCPLALSCGAAEFGKDGADTLDALLSAADGAMYQNKAARKAARMP